ncbi:metalloregulator ArsR/SmtB family transcription factor [Cellulomonas sp. ACRRI]|uniref:ArsR/SmtB family transcription factor n=1 Tax=Cellulomonas sp. ACRRI TaxID=2918188 RepID=UPI001EF370F2|nr:metalloregulator ArsR/SmtB family transcription factor [Cellulomonas sp. ACRRI]MCG7284760.1 metalloregulator ArsR/SmtB family transcription factor [Cellulomonas sp. ACRRI]
MPEKRELDAGATAAYAHLFHVLADPARLSIVQHLASGEHRVRDLVDHIGLAQSTVSKHLSHLRECELVSVRTEGRASWFSLAEPRLLADVIASTERLLRATGTPASLCGHIHALMSEPSR